MKWWLGGLLLLAAAAGACNIVLTRLGHLMEPRWASEADTLLLVVLLAIAVLAAAGLVLVRRGARPSWVIGLAGLIVVTALVPNLYDARRAAAMRAAQDAALRALDDRTTAAIEARRKDIETRFSERRPYSGDEAREFIVFVTGADLSLAGGRDRSSESIALLRRALEDKLLDPNTIVKEPFRADLSAEPLFLNFYRKAKPAPERDTVLMRDWTILRLLVEHGADLATSDADAVAIDLRKTATPVFNGLYVELK